MYMKLMKHKILQCLFQKLVTGDLDLKFILLWEYMYIKVSAVCNSFEKDFL